MSAIKEAHVKQPKQAAWQMGRKPVTREATEAAREVDGADGGGRLVFQKPNETRCKTGRTSAKVRATKSRQNIRNECTQSIPLDPKLMFWCVSYHLGAFRTVWLPYETRCKTG